MVTNHQTSWNHQTSIIASPSMFPLLHVLLTQSDKKYKTKSLFTLISWLSAPSIWLITTTKIDREYALALSVLSVTKNDRPFTECHILLNWILHNQHWTNLLCHIFSISQRDNLAGGTTAPGEDYLAGWEELAGWDDLARGYDLTGGDNPASLAGGWQYGSEIEPYCEKFWPYQYFANFTLVIF